MWNLKNNTNELMYKAEANSDPENRLMVTKVEKGGEGQIRSLQLTDTHYYI